MDRRITAVLLCCVVIGCADDEGEEHFTEQQVGQYCNLVCERLGALRCTGVQHCGSHCRSEFTTFSCPTEYARVLRCQALHIDTIDWCGTTKAPNLCDEEQRTLAACRALAPVVQHPPTT